MYYQAIGPNRFKLQTLCGFCGFYFYRTNAQSPQYKMLRVKFIDKFVSNLLIILSLIVIAHLFIFFGLIYELFFQNISRMTLMTMHLPFLEKDSNIEFTLNTIVQIIMGLYALVGAVAIEIATCTINHTITIAPELIQYNLTEFEEEFHDGDMDRKSILLLRNCFVQVQDFNRYVNENNQFKMFFFWIFC